MKIVKCTLKDINRLAALISADAGQAYLKADDGEAAKQRAKLVAENLSFFFRSLLLSNGTEIYLAYNNSRQVTGCFCISRIPEHEGDIKVGEIKFNYVPKPFRGLNYGSQCLKYIEKNMRIHGYKKVYVWLISTNEQVKKFYLKHNYQPLDKMRDVLSNNLLKEQRFEKNYRLC